MTQHYHGSGKGHVTSGSAIIQVTLQQQPILTSKRILSEVCFLVHAGSRKASLQLLWTTYSSRKQMCYALFERCMFASDLKARCVFCCLRMFILITSTCWCGKNTKVITVIRTALPPQTWGIKVKKIKRGNPYNIIHT